MTALPLTSSTITMGAIEAKDLTDLITMATTPGTKAITQTIMAAELVNIMLVIFTQDLEGGRPHGAHHHGHRSKHEGHHSEHGGGRLQGCHHHHCHHPEHGFREMSAPVPHRGHKHHGHRRFGPHTDFGPHSPSARYGPGAKHYKYSEGMSPCERQETHAAEAGGMHGFDSGNSRLVYLLLMMAQSYLLFSCKLTLLLLLSVK